MKLKQQTPGEVLTTNEVLNRLRKLETNSSDDQSEPNLSDNLLEEIENGDTELEEINISNLVLGKFIIVEFRGGKKNTIFKYVCLVDEIEVKK